MILSESFRARGHENIRATHRKTLEITREEEVSPRGDCIIAVASEKSVADLSPEIKGRIRERWFIALVIEIEGIFDYTIGVGDPSLSLRDPLRMIVRKSDYTDHKTLIIRASKAAIDIDRALVERLRSRSTIATITILVSENIEEIKNEIYREFIKK
ncbi:MAG: DUF371 domain-containing protein [Sulfolobales archaeon]